MPAFRLWIAYVLLTCFVRVLVPDTWLLVLHPHKHTVHAATATKSALLSAKHQHCSVDHFYDVPFQPSELVRLLLPAQTTYALCWVMPRQSVWQHPLLGTASLRGPPAPKRFC